MLQFLEDFMDLCRLPKSIALGKQRSDNFLVKNLAEFDAALGVDMVIVAKI
jgi:hypothetical protein